MRELYRLPIVNEGAIQRWSGFSRPGAHKLIDRFVKIGILEPKDPKQKYDMTFVYRRYLDIFEQR